MQADTEDLSSRSHEEADRIVQFADGLWQRGFTSVPNVILMDSDLSTAARLVYAGLMFYAREDDKAWPGQEKFAGRMGMSERALRTAIRELEQVGLVRTNRRGRGRTNLYRLCEPRSAKNDSSGAADIADQERQNLPESKKTQLEQDAERRSKEADPALVEVQQVWDYYIAAFAPPRAKLGPNRVRGIKRALQEVDVSTLLRAIDGLKNFRAHRPGNTALETIWRTYRGTGTMVERIEFFAAQSKGSTPGGKVFPSADAAIVAQRQLDVQRGHRFQGDPEMVGRAERSEAWLREHGIETIRRENDGYPTFRPLRETMEG